MEDGFSRKPSDEGSCGNETNAWGCGRKTDGRVYVVMRKEVALAARQVNWAVALRRMD